MNTKNSNTARKEKLLSGGKPVESIDRSVYINGIKMIQKQEKIGYFFTLIISLVLVLIMFYILSIV